jgi:hypothetical protein
MFPSDSNSPPGAIVKSLVIETVPVTSILPSIIPAPPASDKFPLTLIVTPGWILSADPALIVKLAQLPPETIC